MFDINELFSNRIGGRNYLNSKLNNLKKSKEYILNKEENFNEDNNLEFNKTCSGYLKVEYNLDIDYKNEIMYCSGISEIMNISALAFINKDDYVVTTTLAEGNEIIMGRWLDCNVYEYKINKFNRYLIDFEDIDENILKKCKLLYLNYPNNPTGSVADKEFFKEVVKYAKKYNFIVVNNASYIDLCFDDKDKNTFLSVNGAKDVGIELYNVNKRNVIVGNKDIIKVFSFIKDSLNLDRDYDLKKDDIFLLENYEKMNKDNKEKYLRRHNLIKETLTKHGFKINVPPCGIYQYIPIPKKCNGVGYESASEFAVWLQENVHLFVTPYDKDGKYIRLSMDFDAEDEEIEKKIATELDSRLSKYKFEF